MMLTVVSQDMAAVAPMDLVVRSDPASIPLRCIICPKKPNFSDLSHLLTHISSKSHLAHRFKVELKARDDRAALEQVRQYDTWCERYGVNALLAERMAAKEQKKTGRRPRPSNTTKNEPETSASHHALVKPDPDEYEPLPGTGHWSAAPGHHQDGYHDHFDNSSYHTPNLKRSPPDQSAPSTPENGKRVMYYRRWPSEAEIAADGASVTLDLGSESTEFDDDANKLKGVKYPGMGLFDSADVVQKRMRNQRKDDSVLKQMEETSSVIEPNEFVWTEDGEFQRVRDIYATPSVEGSPDRKLEDLDDRKPRRGRRSATTVASGRGRTRASARLTRHKAAQSRRGRQDDDERRSGAGDAYDIFRDPPKRSSAQTESPLRESGFELRRRTALQPLNSNRSMVSTGQKPGKPVSYMPPRDTTFTAQPPVTNGHYFPHQHSLGAGSFNPLCVQTRGAAGAYYNPYGYSSFGNETKPSTANFQAINAMNLSNMAFNAFGGPFASDSTNERADQDFEL
ncbi:hypothetical protein N657DRAFT_586429 [Parathielavia appendiculata]|uniref:Uncharacterized protein n=1 Tax=Parathielavia appendiculata TaxID=2587402 RepID=A0AAN6U9N1_9PEZI|nr:hypothetical protein N657DRAFT_586429 [Parathielavia appendiculata]